MKRGAILLFRFSAKVSLLLCLSCVAIWIGSYRWQCGIDYGTRNSDLEILVTRGEFVSTGEPTMGAAEMSGPWD